SSQSPQAPSSCTPPSSRPMPVPTCQSQLASPGQFPLPTNLQDNRKILGGCLALSLSEFPGIFCRPSAVHLKKNFRSLFVPDRLHSANAAWPPLPQAPVGACGRRTSLVPL